MEDGSVAEAVYVRTWVASPVPNPSEHATAEKGSEAMDLDHSAEQEMLREMVRGVCSSYARTKHPGFVEMATEGGHAGEALLVQLVEHRSYRSVRGRRHTDAAPVVPSSIHVTDIDHGLYPFAARS